MARGKVSQSPGRGKKIDTIHFDVEQAAGERVVTRKVEIHLYLQKKFEDTVAPPAPVTATQILAVCEGHEEVSTDINIVVKAMRAHLDKKYQINWETWLLVEVQPQRPWRGEGNGLSLQWREVERGETLDGDVLMREYNPYGDFNNRWQVSAWPQTHKDKKGKAVACVQDTPANRAALEEFSKKLIELRKLLGDFVAPDKIEQTLARIMAGGHLLESHNQH